MEKKTAALVGSYSHTCQKWHNEESYLVYIYNKSCQPANCCKPLSKTMDLGRKIQHVKNIQIGKVPDNMCTENALKLLYWTCEAKCQVCENGSV